MKITLLLFASMAASAAVHRPVKLHARELNDRGFNESKSTYDDIVGFDPAGVKKRDEYSERATPDNTASGVGDLSAPNNQVPVFQAFRSLEILADQLIDDVDAITISSSADPYGANTGKQPSPLAVSTPFIVLLAYELTFHSLSKPRLSCGPNRPKS